MEGFSYHSGGDIVSDIRRNAFGIWVVFRVEVRSDGNALKAVEDPEYRIRQYLDLKFAHIETRRFFPF